MPVTLFLNDDGTLGMDTAGTISLEVQCSALQTPLLMIKINDTTRRIISTCLTNPIARLPHHDPMAKTPRVTFEIVYVTPDEIVLPDTLRSIWSHTYFPSARAARDTTEGEGTP